MARASSVALAGVAWPVWAAGAALLLLLVNRASGGSIVREGAAGITAGAVGAVADTGAGVVYGIGDALGVPRTDVDKCDAAVADGRWWDASFACPAGRFVGAGWQSVFGGGQR